MADFPSKKAKVTTRAPRVRYTLELAVEPGMEERLESLKARVQRLKEGLRIASRTPMGNVILMERLLDSFERSEQRGMASYLASDAATQTDVLGSNILPYVLCYGENTTGCFDVHTRGKADEDYFLASTDAMRNLLGTMASYNGKCPLCGFLFDMESFSFLRQGHAVRISVNCVAGHSLRWYSSSITAGKFTVNLRMIHGFTSTGLTETQYVNYSKASNIGHVEEKYISTGYSGTTETSGSFNSYFVGTCLLVYMYEVKVSQ